MPAVVFVSVDGGAVMGDWWTGEGFSPHGMCMVWDPALLTANALSDSVMGISYVACGGLIFWFGRKRPDMAPGALFHALSLVFVLCGLVHLSDVAVLWVPAYPPQAVLKTVAALGSGLCFTVLAILAPRSLSIPSIAQLQEINARLKTETAEHGKTTRRLKRLAAAIEQNPNIVILTDRDGTIEYVNRSFEVMTGYRRDDVLGRNPALLAAGSTPRWVYENLWHSVRGQREWRGELQDRRQDGSEFWVSSSIAPIYDEKDEVDGFVAIQHDISDRKAAEEEMLVARRQAEIASKAKSELLANMSHELRTPLNAVIGFAEVMTARVFGPLGSPKYEEYCADIQGSARHLLDIINDVLDVSAIEAGKLTLFEERVPLAGVVEAAQRMVAGRAEAQGVTLAVAPCPPVAVMADQRRLKQVLINLMSNAVKFTPPGGSVSVSAEVAPDRTLRLVVADTGRGMTEEELRVALEVFGQVEDAMQRRHQGTGLGLPISIGIMERHGGALFLQSKKGEGTRAVAVLPPVRVFLG